MGIKQMRRSRIIHEQGEALKANDAWNRLVDSFDAFQLAALWQVVLYSYPGSAGLFNLLRAVAHKHGEEI
jgi:hypothetical protein